MNGLSLLKIEQYRGIKNLELKDLNRVNVFVGPNNCGKTSILEAVSLAVPLNNKKMPLFFDAFISRYRKIDLNMFKYIFPINANPYISFVWKSHQEEQCIKTLIEYKEKYTFNELGQRRLKLNMMFNYRYLDETNLLSINMNLEKKDNSFYSDTQEKLAKKNFNLNIPYNYISFSRFDIADKLINNIDTLLENNQRNDLIEVLKIFDESIKNFEIIGESRTIKIFSTKYEKELSIFDYGNGMYKAFLIITAAMLSKNGILLIDEIEAGIHIGALSEFMLKLLEVCKINDVQVFMTTHSLEVVDTILYDCKDRDCLDEIAVYHIKNTQEKTIAKRYGGNRLIKLRDSMGFDVR